ncbi:MAG: AAA family ATPase, partial [Verrucomicrobiae bacterium]|nr:AAA family ATPase [Verrucomicrobiae bacterium]
MTSAPLMADRYELRGKTGEDLVSEFYDAWDARENRPVRIQWVLAKAAQRSAENLFRFRRLQRELAELRHAHVVPILDQLEWEGREAIALDPEGEPLVIGGDALPPAEAANRLVEIATALQAAHDHGILHGSLHPACVRITADGNARLEGFGTVLLLDLTAVRAKENVRRVFGYLAPEQSGILRKPTDARSDLYSLGILAYEILSGAHPYPAEEANALISQHISRTPRSLREIRSEIPEALERVVFKLIAKDPEDRYQTAQGVLSDLNEIADALRAGRAPALAEVGLKDRVRKPSFSTRLIGRDDELARLRHAVSRAKNGKGAVVFIHGEPGVGKTRLINELRADVHAIGGLFIGAKCNQYDAGSPFKVLSMAAESFIERVRRMSAEEQQRQIAAVRENVGELGGEIAKVAPRIAELIGVSPALAELDPHQQRTRFLVTAVAFLAGLGSREQPAVLFLEDLQWADEGSCELLERVAPRLENQFVTLIASYRDTEVGPDHPVARIQKTLESRFDDVPVRAFAHEQTLDMVSRVLMETPERVAGLAEYLWGRTHGNPFFILELLRTMVEEGFIRYDEGRCRFDPAELRNVNLPDNIVEAVLRRIRDLPESDLQVLSCAA